jgi:uncharacterized membrane protein
MKRRISILALSLLFLSACSSGFVYNRLDTLVAWYLEGLVTLTKSQRADLRRWLGETLDWHRGSELERYAAFLKALSERALQPADRTVFEQAERQFRRFTIDVANKSAPEAAQLLMALSDKQFDELVRNLEKKAAEHLEEEQELIEDDAWHERRAKQISKQFKRWTGRRTPEQAKLIRQTADRLLPTYPEWLASQRAWRAALAEAMTKRHENPQSAHRELTALLSSPEHHWTEAYRSKQDHNREQTMQLLVALDESLSPEQRQELHDRMIELAERLEAWAAT